LSQTFKLKRPAHDEADARVNKLGTKNKFKVNLTGNPNSCLIKIGKQKVRCLIDSGASTSLINWKFYSNLVNKPSLQKASAHLESVDGSTLVLKGKIDLKFEMKGLVLTHSFL